MKAISIGLCGILAGCGAHAVDAKTYEVRYLAEPAIRIDGRLDEPAWERAAVERGFIFPWREAEAPATEFRALADDHKLYFAFRVRDDDIVLAPNYRGKGDVVAEDRVELFFAVDDELAAYYCLEMDPLGRTLDYKAARYRKFDFAWEFPGLDVAASRTDRGYVVEGALPLASFEKLGFPPLASGRPWRVGVFRAEFSHGSGEAPVEHWISWIDPKTPKPDFHVPAALGRFRLVGR